MIKRLSAVGALLLLLAACSRQDAKPADPYAGLETQILTWRQSIVQDSPLCKTAGQACASFEVACKAARDLTADDPAKGVTARVVGAITFTGFDPKLKQPQTGTAAAEFAKSAAGWTRTEHKPVNLATCADLAS